MAMFASEARKNLFPLIRRVNDDRAPVEIVTRDGERAFLVAAADYESMAATDYLLRSPANAERLLETVRDIRRGNGLTPHSVAELEALTDRGVAALPR